MNLAILDGVEEGGVASLLDEWQEAGGGCHVLALLPEVEKTRVPELQRMCRAAGAHVVGGIFPQLIHSGRLVDHGALLLRLPATPGVLIAGVDAVDGVERVCREAVDYVEGHGDIGDAALFCLFDALVPNIATHLDAWYLQLADRVRYFGVNAGNERFVPEPCLFDNERFIGGGVLVQLLPGHPGASLAHGYSVPDSALTATAASGNAIIQIDWRPALDVYREIMQAQYGVAIDRRNFYEHAVHFPFGIMRADGEVLVRIPVALGEQGEIVCVGEIPPHSVLALLDARSGTARAPAELAADLARHGAPPTGGNLLLFYCAGRRMHVGAAIDAELAAVARETGAATVAGALSLGEIGGARNGGYPLFHNATLVGVPWGVA